MTSRFLADTNGSDRHGQSAACSCASAIHREVVHAITPHSVVFAENS
jgi:hypothetical protein